MLSHVVLQGSSDGTDGTPTGKGTAGGGFTILSEKKLFLGQKVCSQYKNIPFLYLTATSVFPQHLVYLSFKEK